MSVVDNLLRADGTRDPVFEAPPVDVDRDSSGWCSVCHSQLERTETWSVQRGELRWDGVTWETPVRSKLVRVRFPAHDCRPDGP